APEIEREIFGIDPAFSWLEIVRGSRFEMRARAESRDHDGPLGRPRRLGILNDYVRIPYANGSSFASQFLYRELRTRGHEVTVVGPTDPLAKRGELPDRYITLSALPFRTHPGVHLPLPTRRGLSRVAECNFDLVLGQTCSALMEIGVWLR